MRVIVSGAYNNIRNPVHFALVFCLHFSKFYNCVLWYVRLIHYFYIDKLIYYQVKQYHFIEAFYFIFTSFLFYTLTIEHFKK